MQIRTKVHLTLKRYLGLLVLSFFIWFSIGLMAPSKAHANIPVIDSAAIAEMLQQYVQMVRQFEMLVQQAELMKQEISSVTGHYGMGMLGGDVNGWGTTSWADIANMVAKGFNPGDSAQVRAYKETQAKYAGQFPILSSGLQTTNPRMNAIYNEAYSDSISGLSLGEGTFNQIQNYLSDVQTLKNRIDHTDNLKSAVDLNTAVNVRVAQLNGEILRLQAAQLRLEAAQHTEAASGYAAQAEFFAE